MFEGHSIHCNVDSEVKIIFTYFHIYFTVSTKGRPSMCFFVMTSPQHWKKEHPLIGEVLINRLCDSPSDNKASGSGNRNTVT